MPLPSSGPLATAWLALRSLFWTVLLPGFFAGYVPWRFFGLGSVTLRAASLTQWAGLLVAAAGLGLLGVCIVAFAAMGRGTLSPADPPRALVGRGPYRLVRNPMYLGVTLILWGEALLLGSIGLLVYWAAWFAAANLFVRGYEEPALRRRFGNDYARYAGATGRWWPHLRR